MLLYFDANRLFYKSRTRPLVHTGCLISAGICNQVVLLSDILRYNQSAVEDTQVGLELHATQTPNALRATRWLCCFATLQKVLLFVRLDQTRRPPSEWPICRKTCATRTCRTYSGPLDRLPGFTWPRTRSPDSPRYVHALSTVVYCFGATEMS